MIYHPPPTPTRAMDGEPDFGQMPRVARHGASVTQPAGVRLPELHTSLADGLIGHAHPMSEPLRFGIAVPETAAEGQPDTVADDLGRETMALRELNGWCAHTMSLAHQVGVGQAP